MLSKKKRVLILCGMVALLLVTGFLNVYLNRLGDKPTSGDGGAMAGDFFTTYRTDRLASRNLSIQYLDGIIADAASSAEDIQKAQNKKFEIGELMEKELVLEGLIKSLGFEDCVVTLSTDNINCILKSADLTSEQVAQILDKLVSETKTDATHIKIWPAQ